MPLDGGVPRIERRGATCHLDRIIQPAQFHKDMSKYVMVAVHHRVDRNAAHYRSLGFRQAAGPAERFGEADPTIRGLRAARKPGLQLCQ